MEVCVSELLTVIRVLKQVILTLPSRNHAQDHSAGI